MPGNPAKKRTNGGAAAVGGFDFQAAVTAIAGVHMISGRPLDWIGDLEDDTPIAISVETGGPGDDVCLELKNHAKVEIQVKKGLRADTKFWSALDALCRGVGKEVNYGVLAIASDSSPNIAFKLCQDIKRLGQGRIDGIRDLARKLHKRLKAAALPIQETCSAIRIVSVHALHGDSASVVAAKAELARVCVDSEAAWNHIYGSAIGLIASRGRWTAASLVKELRAKHISMQSEGTSPGVLIDKVVQWAFEVSAQFSHHGSKQWLSTDHAWLPLKAIANAPPANVADVDGALSTYHSLDGPLPTNNERIVAAESIGTFYKNAVILAGPGMGKSTLLTKMTRLFVNNGYPTLKVRLKAVSARMNLGYSFIGSIVHLGLAESGIRDSEVLQNNFDHWVILCDGLDECGDKQAEIVEGLRRFALGHKSARVVVTTRTAGYQVQLLDWRHYQLQRPEQSDASVNLAILLRGIANPGTDLHVNADSIASRQLAHSHAERFIGRSPLLLGMAATLIAKSVPLGTNKSQLYQSLFELIHGASRNRSYESKQSDSVLERALDILGWDLLCNSARPISLTYESLSCALRSELGATKLDAKRIADDCVAHWEDVGLIERIHIGNCSVFTFVHTTFCEFAAARYISNLDDLDTRRDLVRSMVLDPSREEVVSFVAYLGLENDIAATCVESAGRENKKALMLALDLIADPSLKVNKTVRTQILDAAWAMIASNSVDGAYSLATRLIDIVSAAPREFGSRLEELRQYSALHTRLIAWACIAIATPALHGIDELMQTVRLLAEEVNRRPLVPQRGWNIFSGGRSSGLIHSVALVVLRRIADERSGEEAAKYAHDSLSKAPFDNPGFAQRANQILKQHGLSYRDVERHAISLAEFFAPPPEYKVAFRAMEVALLKSVAQGGEKGLPDVPRSFAQLGGLYRIAGLEECPAIEIYSWTNASDDDAVKEVISALVSISSLDQRMLAIEATAALQILDQSPISSSFYESILPSVDIQDVDWTRVNRLSIDPVKLERALGHESQWVRVAATYLLASGDFLGSDRIKHLLETLHGPGLAAAAFLAIHGNKSRGTDLVLSRLKGQQVGGFEHLYDILRESDVGWSEKMGDAIASGVLCEYETIAESAARLALHLVGKGASMPAAPLRKALEKWQKKATPPPAFWAGSRNPSSILQDILKRLEN